MFKLSKTTIIFLLFFIFLTSNLSAQWEKMGELYGGNFSLIADSSKIVAYGWAKPAHLSLDTGKTWKQILNFGFPDLEYLDIYLYKDKVFSMNRNSVTVSSDNGQSWQQTEAPFSGIRPLSMVVADGSIYMIAKDSVANPTFSVFKYNNASNNWDIQSYFPPNTVGFNVSPNKIYAITANGFFTSNKNTINWVRTNVPPSLNVSAISDKDIAKITATDSVVMLINTGRLFISKDNGTTWSLPYENGYAGCTMVLFKNNKFYLKVLSAVFESGDNGTTWKALTNGWVDNTSLTNRRDLTLVGLTLYTSGGSTGIMALNIGEDIWRYLPTSPESYKNIANLNRSGNTFIASTFDGWLYRSINEGKSWTPMGNLYTPIKTSIGLRGVRDIMTKDSFVFLYGTFSNTGLSDPRMIQSKNYGKTWQYNNIITPFNDYIFKGDTIYTIGIIDASAWEGVRYSIPPYTNWQRISDKKLGENFVIKDDIIIAQSSNSIVRMTKDGTILPASNFNKPIKKMLVKGTRIFIVSQDSIFISTDNGFSWTSKKTPGTTNFFHQTYLEAYNEILFAVVRENGVFVSKDDGNTWLPFNSGLPSTTTFETFQGAHFIDGGWIYIVLNDFGLYRRSVSDFNINTLSGNIFNDKNNNGAQDVNDTPISNIVVSAKKSNIHSTTDTNGYYKLNGDLLKNDTIRINPRTPYASVKPILYIFQQADTGKNFGIYYTPNIKDLRITATSIEPARPGFENKVVLTVENIGSVAMNAAVSFNYSNAIQYQSAAPNPDATFSQLLTWNLSNFQPFEKRNITIQFKTPSTVALNTVLTHIAKIDPIFGDSFPKDNIDTLRLTVVGSFDPNDKKVNIPVIDFKQLSNPLPLVYTIRFQNTGTFSATFVRIVDTLSPNADISSLQILSSSHPMTYSLKDKGILECRFDNINLPDSSSNELASHGFVKYSIKPLSTLRIGDTIRNKAYIYFDYNAPIITNTTENKVVFLSETKDFINYTPLNVIPNPTDGQIYFQIPESENELSSQLKIHVMNNLGKTVLLKTVLNKALNQLDLMGLPSGLYILKAQLEDKYFVAKIVLVKD